MKADLAFDIDLNTLGAESGYRRSHFEQIKRMLRNLKISILEAALAAGFENQQHFATVFRPIAGVSPSEYRRQL